MDTQHEGSHDRQQLWFVVTEVRRAQMLFIWDGVKYWRFTARTSRHMIQVLGDGTPSGRGGSTQQSVLHCRQAL